MPDVWSATTERIRKGRRVAIRQGAEPVSFRRYLDLLADDGDFAAWYGDFLGNVQYEAFFWEHPPICKANIDAPAEFVLIDSPALAGLRADPAPFRSCLESGEAIVAFPSLGGDAILIAPAPAEPLCACAHLAAFVRHAPESLNAALWRETGRRVRDSLGDRGLWLSTSGLGVAWLHVRLDSCPKYYQHLPYRETR